MSTSNVSLPLFERLTGLNRNGQIAALLVGLGHGGTHWPTGAVYVLLPFVTKELGLSIVEVGTLMTVYYASAVAASFGGGVLVDLAGRQVAVMVGALLMGGGALFAFAFIDQFLWLFVPLVLIGVAKNLWHPPAISYLSRRFPQNRGYVLSIHGIGGTLGNAIAPPAIGAMIASLSWPVAVSAGALPIVLLAVVVGVFFLSPTGSSHVHEKARIGYTMYFRNFCKVVLDRVLFVVILSIGFRGMTQAVLLIFLPFYMAGTMAANPLWIGLSLAFFQIGGVVSGPFFGSLSDRFGRKPVVVVGLAFATLSALTLPIIGHSGNIYAFVAAVFFFGSASLGVRPVLQSWVMDLTPVTLAGGATSLIFGVGGSLAILAPLIGGFIANAGGVVFVFFLIAAAMFLAGFLVFMLPRSAET